MVKLIRSMHDGMKAEVQVDGSTTLEFEVENVCDRAVPLPQHCFNIYFKLVIGRWLPKT